MKAFLLAAGLAAIGCGVTISDGARTGGGSNGDGSNHDSPDANTDPVNSPDAPVAAATCSSRVVFLNFDGVTLKSTNLKSDATNDAAYWAGVQLHVPPFRANASTRGSDIAAITAAVTQGLSQFPITVVTTRPAAGPYSMVAFGGRSTSDFGYQTEYYAIDALDCGDQWPSDVSWVGDIAPSTTLAADFALGAIGYGLGLSGTTDPNTCMCGWGSNCSSADVPCTFSTSAPAAPLCSGAGNTQDEVATFHKAFCE